MAKVTTEHFHVSDRDGNLMDNRERPETISVSLDIMVSAGGLFSTKFPPSLVERINGYNENLLEYQTRNGRNVVGSEKAYMYAPSKELLMGKINTTLKALLGRTLELEEYVIKYYLETEAMFCTVNNMISPDAVGTGEQDVIKWYDASASPKPFSLKISAKVLLKRTYKYLNGNVTSRYLEADRNKFKLNRYKVSFPLWERYTREIPYTPEGEKFFLNALEMICKITRDISSIAQDPSEFYIAINNNKNLLGNE